MAEPPDSGNTGEGAPTALEGGAYDLIKQRLNDQGATLREELGLLQSKLDHKDKEVGIVSLSLSLSLSLCVYVCAHVRVYVR